MNMKAKQMLFLFLFLVSIYGPTLLFPLVKSHVDTTNYENRALAEFPKLSPDTLVQFPSQFETYYTDHVPFKNQLVQLKNRFEQQFLNQQTFGDVTLGKEDWMFYTVSVPGEDSMADYQHTNLYTDAQKDAIGTSFRAFCDDFAARGIRTFIFVAPNKESIYGQYMPDNIPVYGSASRTDLLIPYLQENYDLPIYNLKEVLLPYADQYQLFRKYDTHWNQIGSSMAALKVIQVLTGREIPFESLTIEQRGGTDGDLSRFLNLSQIYNDDPLYYISTDLLPGVTAQCVESADEGTYEIYTSDSPNDRTLLFIGDSFSYGVKPYLPQFYSTCIFVNFNNYSPELFEQYHVDDLVYLTVERNQRLFENMPEFVTTGAISGEEAE